MQRSKYQLQAFMVDNNVAQRAEQEVHLALANEGVLHVSPVSLPAPLSTFVWALDDSSVIGLPGILETDAAKVFAISLSLQSWRFLHSPVIVHTVSVLEVEQQGTFGRLTIKHTSPPVSIDEREFLPVAQALAAVWTMAGSRGDILRESLNSYWDALHSVHTRSRFLSLWAAFERAVNADGKQRTGRKQFDPYAAAASGCSPSDVERLRNLSRWLKHADVLSQLAPDIAESIGRDGGDLKRLLDRSLADRLGFPLGGDYEV